MLKGEKIKEITQVMHLINIHSIYDSNKFLIVEWNKVMIISLDKLEAASKTLLNNVYITQSAISNDGK